jgi:predicted  nucleic acid-binding Zn-ribbon protein
MKDIESDQAECEQIQKQIDQQKEQLEQTREEAETQTEKLQKEIDEIQEEWDQTAADIPTEELDMFKRLADTYDGEAIAHIDEQGQNPPIYTCGSCFMSLPAENINLLMTRDDILRCPNCSRILVLPEQGEEDKS